MTNRLHFRKITVKQSIEQEEILNHFRKPGKKKKLDMKRNKIEQFSKKFISCANIKQKFHGTSRVKRIEAK